MTDGVRRDVRDTAVEPMVFSHESTEKTVARETTGQRTSQMQFSTPPSTQADQSQR